MAMPMLWGQAACASLMLLSLRCRLRLPAARQVQGNWTGTETTDYAPTARWINKLVRVSTEWDHSFVSRLSYNMKCRL